MKYKIKIILTIVAVLLAKITFSQSIYDVLGNNNLNYFEKVNQIEAIKEAGYRGDVTIDSSALKRYVRWQTFWNSCVDAQGEFSTYLTNLSDFYPNFNQRSSNNIWESIGPRHLTAYTPPRPYIGRLQSIEVVIKGEDTTIFAGTNSAGLWKSTDGGETYNNITPNIFGGVRDIEIHPINKDTMFVTMGVVANGFLNSGFYGTGCYRTYDGGDNWENILPFNSSHI